MPLILGTNSVKDTGFNVKNSLRQNRADSSFLSKTFDNDGTHHDKGTISVWVKRSEIGAEAAVYTAGASNREFIRFETNDTLTYRSVAEGYHLNTNRVFRDVSAWYHIVVAFDSSEGTASNRQKIYVNGVQETSFATETYTPNQNMDHKFLSGELQRLGADAEQNTPFANCYFCEVVGIDGVAHAPTSFGEFDEDSGIWKPIDVSDLTFGTNGFHLNFENSSALGTDVSGNGNTFANTNLATTDQSIDTCINNFVTLNPLLNYAVLAQTPVLSEGNLNHASTSSGTHGASSVGTFGPSSGKWYWEAKQTATVANGFASGVRVLEGWNPKAADDSTFYGDNALFGGFGYGYSYNAGHVLHNAQFVTTNRGNGVSPDDIVGHALDLDNGALYFSINGTFQASGDPTSGSSKTNAQHSFTVNGSYAPAVYGYSSAVFQMNFGSPMHSISSGNADGNSYGNFEFAVPSGYFALNTKNLAEYGG